MDCLINFLVDGGWRHNVSSNRYNLAILKPQQLGSVNLLPEHLGSGDVTSSFDNIKELPE